ncbi:MAG: HD domain-containing protein [Pirellula sp.]|jgi:phosphonate degradation associated HDIG domain protein
MPQSAISKLVQLFSDRGQVRYEGHAVTHLQHALQCAMLAKRQGAESTLVAAALLHDIGHLFNDQHSYEWHSHATSDMHEETAYCWLKEHFGPAVADPIRLHVLAKRYLCTIEPEYIHALSPAAQRCYFDLGGPMSRAELDDFRDEPFAFEAVQLRRWDDLAVQPGVVTWTLEEFLPLLESLVLEPVC